ncbi:Monocarboxylate transporter 3 [Frankliniella fusca]|uniref:Monocarboxylate transporter 3 n=1 Tax=Frankliniella fusca TaxID=407009 RepID=A0AAE1GX90_9NEOP|nr:Monocarboxylate transporter 3 [Frankliniella fusca]
MAAAAPPLHAEPPDGGYAWVILIAHSFNLILSIQLMTMVGLVFKDMFNELALPATDIAVILNLHVGLSLLLGIFTGALVRRFGYRKVAAAGSLLTCAGLLLTSVSTTYFEFLINFSIVTSAGMGLSTPAFAVAFHSYFRRRRSLATAVTASVVGVVGIVSPQVIELLLWEYGSRGTCVLQAGYALNVLVAASLLQPVGWHSRSRPRDGAAGRYSLTPHPPRRAGEPAHAVNAVHPPPASPRAFHPPCAADKSDVKVLVEAADEESIPGDDFALPPLPIVKEETDAELRRELYGSLASMRRRASTVSSYHTARRPSEASNTLWASASVLDLADQVWSSRPALDKLLEKAAVDATAAPGPPGPRRPEDTPALPAVPRPRPPRCLCDDLRRFGRFLVNLFDLGLLGTPVIANVMVGLALALFAEGNFHRFLPLILAERGLSTPRIANILSLMAVADTSCKLLAPLLHGLLRQSSRTMCTVALVVLVAGRTVLALTRDDAVVLAMAVTLGGFKGFRVVFHAQVVPDSVPSERLAAAIGLQSVLSGIVSLLCGPLIGVIRDQSGSYDTVIFTCNAFTLVCLSMWVVEFVTAALRGRRRGRSQSQDSSGGGAGLWRAEK